jgi:microcompartment protein CcmL/EutN
MAPLRACGSLQDHVMKKYPAMAVVEFAEIAQGMFATDKMLKKAPIAYVRCGNISRGRYLTVIGGSTASVEESFEEGLFWGASAVLDSVLLADIHPDLHDAILGRRADAGSGALAIVETPTVACNVRAAEIALKGTPVRLVEIRLADDGLSGKGLSIYQGELHDVEAAIDIVRGHLSAAGKTVAVQILSSPHEAMQARVARHSEFGASEALELEGETA